MEFEQISERMDEIAQQIVDAAYKVHSTLGAGLLEVIYEICLFHELTKRGLKCLRQVEIPIYYDGILLKDNLKLDLLVEDMIIIEIKAVEKIIPVFNAQLMTYMKLANKRLGFLINFNVPLIKDGLKRVAL